MLAAPNRFFRGVATSDGDKQILWILLSCLAVIPRHSGTTAYYHDPIRLGTNNITWVPVIVELSSWHYYSGLCALHVCSLSQAWQGVGTKEPINDIYDFIYIYRSR